MSIEMQNKIYVNSQKFNLSLGIHKSLHNQHGLVELLEKKSWKIIAWV